PKARLGQTVFPLPDAMSYETAAMIEPYAVGLRIAHHAAPSPHDTAVVFGLGTIGLTAVQTLMLAGAGRVIGVDRPAKRLGAARELGAAHVVDASHAGWDAKLAELTGAGAAGYGGAPSGNADIVCECTGSPAVLASAIETARRGGRLVVVALYEEPAELDPNQIVIKDLRVHGSFGYGSGAFKGFPDALALLEQGKLQSEQLITHRMALEQIEPAFEAQLDRDASIKVMVSP
ncbi:MAG: zinc-dependent alcohol dehydrogenase, partial [Gaiellaceae bacterium]